MGRSTLRIAFAIGALVALFVVRYAREERVPEPAAPTARTAPTPAPSPSQKPTVTQSPAENPPSRDGKGSVAEAYRKRQSDVWVEGSGTVEATLPDDRQGSRHQKFIVRVDRDLTVLVSHNIDLAPRVPLDRGDEVAFKGEYIWNGKGGLVHWTHRDPRGGRGGWIRLGHEVYE
ncbi:MAG: DUF3465 domain-containing protein [Thermoanaerobaculia bacterium]|nr:DUF3465 domain-containing protein [Thermoanaerobaculia bacterium]